MSVCGHEMGEQRRQRTVKVTPVTMTRQNAKNAKAAHSQSEPWVLMWRSALGGLRFNASLAMSDIGARKSLKCE